MGCRASKSRVEPRIVKIPGCSKLSRSYSSPVQSADGDNFFKDPKCESYHVVSLTSSTYGSLRLDSLPHSLEEDRIRANSGRLGDVIFDNTKISIAPYSWSQDSDPLPNATDRNGNIEGVKYLESANHKQVETINRSDFVEDLEDEKAALQMLRGLMERSRMSVQHSRKSSPRTSTTIHTVEDVDSVLDVRRSLPTEYRFRRGSSIESVPSARKSHDSLDSDIMSGFHSPMLLKRRSRALQNCLATKESDYLRREYLSRSQEFIPIGRNRLSQSQEFVPKGRSNLSQSQEFIPTERNRISQSQEFVSKGRSNLSQSQEFIPTGRNSLSQSQEFASKGRSNLSQGQDFDYIRNNLNRSQELDSIRRGNLFTNQEFDSRRRSNLTRSQEFSRPPLAKPKEVIATRLSFDEKKIAMPPPDIVLRSPMLKGLSGLERPRVRPGQQSSMSRSDAIYSESRNKSLLQGQSELAVERKSSLPRTAGSTKVSLNINSIDKSNRNGQQKTSKGLEPRVASAVAALSRLGGQKSSLTSQAMSETKPEVSQDQSSKSVETNYTVSNVPVYGSVVTAAKNTNLDVPQEPAQDALKSSSMKQTDRSSSASMLATNNQKEHKVAQVSQASVAPSLVSAATTAAPQDTSSQGVLESVMYDAISSGYELVTKAEVAEAERHDSSPLDPELLASFEEALELFSADDWCTVRLGESDAAVTSGSISDLESLSWVRETVDTLDNPPVEAKLNKFEILENHVENPHSQPGMLKKVLSSKIAPLEIEEQKLKADALEKFEKRCPPGGEERCVLYTTSLRGIRKTFEDCSRLRMILQSSDVQIDERDIAMHGEFRQEMVDLVGRLAPVPRLFIKGRYVGGEEEVSQLHEDGMLSMLLEDLPRQSSKGVCDGCGGVRFIPCTTCCGSCKVVTEEGGITFCKECNENGLARCPICL